MYSSIQSCVNIWKFCVNTWLVPVCVCVTASAKFPLLLFLFFLPQPKAHLKPWFWNLLGARTGNMPVSCTSSTLWPRWPFAPSCALIWMLLVLLRSSRIPPSQTSMSCSSVQTWSRAVPFTWPFWCTAFLDLLRKLLPTTTLGTQCACHGVRTADAGHFMLIDFPWLVVTAWTALTVLARMAFSLSGRSRPPSGVLLKRRSHFLGVSQSCISGIRFCTATRSRLWQWRVCPFLLGWCSTGVEQPWK